MLIYLILSLSYSIPFYPILSHLTLSYLFHFILSFPSYPILSHLTLSYFILSYPFYPSYFIHPFLPILFYPITTLPILFYPFLSILFYPFLSILSILFYPITTLPINLTHPLNRYVLVVSLFVVNNFICVPPTYIKFNLLSISGVR